MLGYNPLVRQIVQVLIWLIDIMSWAIVINSLLSWIMDPVHPVKVFLARLTDPIVAPFRTLSYRLNSSGFPIDFSPLLAFIALVIVKTIIIGLL